MVPRRYYACWVRQGIMTGEITLFLGMKLMSQTVAFKDKNNCSSFQRVTKQGKVRST
jgi:hypothetical protein